MGYSVSRGDEVTECGECGGHGFSRPTWATEDVTCETCAGSGSDTSPERVLASVIGPGGETTVASCRPRNFNGAVYEVALTFPSGKGAYLTQETAVDLALALLDVAGSLDGPSDQVSAPKLVLEAAEAATESVAIDPRSDLDNRIATAKAERCARVAEALRLGFSGAEELRGAKDAVGLVESPSNTYTSPRRMTNDGRRHASLSAPSAGQR